MTQPAATAPEPAARRRRGAKPRIIGNTANEAIYSIGPAVVGLIFWPFLIPELAAIGFGHAALGAIRSSGDRLRGRTLAIVSLVLGYLELALFIIFAIAVLTGNVKLNP